ncbi:MAG: hypothetical protein ING66_00735 [Rhodocyclaceae bacterium]|nr:hypothetical protein [Rhodocyclaceae bacterium]MCA3059518.1 hypothetical protein [Rhodocyclaceae bacterium]MCA3083361.1 hypothetical protein [Rhodocyclaceae bacterium]
MKSELAQVRGWCTNFVKSKKVYSAECNMLHKPPNTAYLTVNIREMPPVKTARATKKNATPRLAKDLVKLLSQWESLLDQKLIQDGITLSDEVRDGILGSSDPEVDALAHRLGVAVQPRLKNVLTVLNGSPIESDRIAASQLINWSGNPAAVFPALPAVLTDDSVYVRNNASRFVSTFARELGDIDTAKLILSGMTTQLKLPFMTDRNKALSGIRGLLGKFPALTSSIDAETKSHVCHIAKTSILDNVGGVAKQLLDVLGGVNCAENVSCK